MPEREITEAEKARIKREIEFRRAQFLMDYGAENSRRDEDFTRYFIFFLGIAILIYFMAPSKAKAPAADTASDKQEKQEAVSTAEFSIPNYIEVLPNGDRKCNESSKIQSFSGLTLNECASRCNSVAACNIFNFVTTGSGYCGLLSSTTCTPVVLSNSANKVTSAQKLSPIETEQPTGTTGQDSSDASSSKTSSTNVYIKYAIVMLVLLLGALSVFYFRSRSRRMTAPPSVK